MRCLPMSTYHNFIKAIHDAAYIWREEMKQVFRDEGVLIFFIIVPIVYPLLYSWIYNNEVVHEVPVVVVDDSHSTLSRELVRKLDASPDVKVLCHAADMDEAKSLVSRQLAKGVYYIPSDFATRLNRVEQATLSVYCDMSLILTYKALYQTAVAVTQHMGAEIQKKLSGKYTVREEQIQARPLDFTDVPIFNPAGGYGTFILPAVLMLILQQTLVLGIGLSAGTAREKSKYGNLIPIHPAYSGIYRIVCGKALCYLMVYAIMGAYLTMVVPRLFSFVTLVHWQDLLCMMIPYVLACVFFGMTISCLVRYRENVMLIVVFVSVPLLFLSGVSWPQSAIPGYWQGISWLFPSSFGIRAFVRMSTMGASFGDVVNEVRCLWIQSAAYFGVACLVYGHQLRLSRRHNLQKVVGVMLLLLLPLQVCVAGNPKMKYPGGKYYIWRYTLKDKQGTSYNLDHPGRWLSHRSIERRKRQGIAVDSTDLPVSNKYLRQIERTSDEALKENYKRTNEWQLIGTSRWNNTVLVRSNDTIVFNRVGALDFIKKAEMVWESPDSIDRVRKLKAHEDFSAWDSIKGDTYGNGKEQIEMLVGQRLHNIGFRGKGITIAVLDGGFQNVNAIRAFNHSNIVGAQDFVYPQSTSFYQETDHGTKVLSTMATNEPEVLVGTAPEARYWLLRCEDQQTEQPVEEDYWAMAAEFADSAGVDIISSSLGYNDYDNHPEYYHQRDLDGRTAFISRTASMLAQKGIILVNSAGNSGMGPWKKIVFPADANDILTVGAINPERKNAPFSGVGPTQDGRVKPDVMALGSPASLISGRGSIVRDMGTSFSTPIVAGLVACLWQALPQKSALEIIRLVRQTCNGYEHPDNIYGFGIPNFWRAYMIGRLDQ